VVAPVAAATVKGLGAAGYPKAITTVADLLEDP
jgi:3-dehydroquinate dehydratase